MLKHVGNDLYKIRNSTTEGDSALILDRNVGLRCANPTYLALLCFGAVHYSLLW